MQDLRSKIQGLKLAAEGRGLTPEEEEDLFFLKTALHELQEKHGMLASPK